jgi:DNA-binding GntR family transcriptional regulator
MIETRSVHHQLIELCQQQLAGGRWAVGERFPSERELAAQHGISRATANKVVAKLVSEGWLEIHRGQGTFVSKRRTLARSLRQLESFTDFARARGWEPRTKVLLFEKDTQAGVSVFKLQRLRYLNEIAVIFEVRWLPTKLYKELTKEDLDGSFYQISRERYGLELAREDLVIRPGFAPQEAGDGWSAPALIFEGSGFDASGQELWTQRLYYHGDYFSLQHSAEETAAFPRFSLKVNANAFSA